MENRRSAQILRSGALWLMSLETFFFNSRSESLYYPFVRLTQICLVCFALLIKETNSEMPNLESIHIISVSPWFELSQDC